MEKKELSFEENFARLQEIVTTLKEGSLSLDDSLSVFEEGIKISKILESKLVDVESKVSIISQEDTKK